MGFIENLRRQKAELDMRAREGAARRTREAAEEIRRQMSTEDYHRNRIIQAKGFLSSSAFPKLLRELQDIYPKIKIIYREPEGQGQTG